MSATITDNFRISILDNIMEDFRSRGRALGDSDYYYIGIGRIQEWPGDSDIPSSISPSHYDERDFRLSVQSYKQVNSASFIVERQNWSNGSIYSAYNDKNWAGDRYNPAQGRYPFYVLTNTNDVYICLKQGRTLVGIAVPSSVVPTDTSGTPFETSDGYVWKYLYNIGSFEANRYLSSNFMPVAKVDSDYATTPAELNQVNIQKTAIPGQVLQIVIDSGGNGYLTAPTITIYGDGDSAEASCIISGGKIVDVFMKRSPDSDFNVARMGSGYTYANVTVSSGTAKLRAVIPSNYTEGLGADPRKDLITNGIMFNIKPSGSENGTFIDNQQFRQVGLLKNPHKDSAQLIGFSGDSAFTDLSGYALRYMIVDAGHTFSFPAATTVTITGSTSSAVAYVDDFDTTNRRLYFHQDEETGFRDFQEGENITASNGAGVGVITDHGHADARYYEYSSIDKFSGELMYVDNRAAIERDPDQTEDIKVVIQI